MAHSWFHQTKTKNRVLVRQRAWLDSLWWLWLLLLALPALWPFYSEGLTRSFDGGLHLLRLSLLNDYIQQGVLLPRWTPSLILGYGYPLYNFYAPGAYYLAEALHGMGHIVGLGLYHAFSGAFIVQILAAAFGLYLLARDIFQADPPVVGGESETQEPATTQPATNIPALVAAVAYLYAPYLLTNVYIRGAIAEAGAQALLPWIFWSMRRLVRADQPQHYFFPTLFAVAALALTHNITLLFLPPVLLLYLLLQWVQQGARWQRLLWIGGALLGAMGVSAFFWLPLLAERHDLADTAYLISRTVWLPGSVWTWQNFLDTGFHFTHTFARPIKVGIVQLVLALLGLLCALPWLYKKRDRALEWGFWLVVAVGIGAMMGAWSLPLWLSNDILPVAQFTWRLLAILSLPLALFVGGIPLLVAAVTPQRWLTILPALIAIVLLILAQRPMLTWMDLYAAESASTSQAVFAQIEVDKGVISGGHRNSSIQEFRPRWADTDLVLSADVEPPTIMPDISVAAATDLMVQLAVEAPAPTFLRFATFYFPGWRVEINGRAVPTYPSTNLGLLTVDIPAGTHLLLVYWRGTWIERTAGIISWLTVIGLLAFALWRQIPRRFLLPLSCLFLIGLWSLFLQPTYATLKFTPTASMRGKPAEGDSAQYHSPVEGPGLSLRGIRFQEAEPGYLTIYPYWYVQSRQPSTLAMHWQLYDATGTMISAVTTHPYYNTIRADSWAPGTLMDDAQRLPLPATLGPGAYQLRLQLFADAAPLTASVPVADYQLKEQPPSPPTPQHALNLRYGEQIQLVGYTARADGALLSAIDELAGNRGTGDGQAPVVRAGEYVRYTLYWQAGGLIEHNYHAFVHLTDHLGQPLVQEDQLPGPLFHAPQLWNEYRAHNDSYLLRIPADATSGLYWPGVGVYDFDSLERLPLLDGAADADRYYLPPIKIIGNPTKPPHATATTRFGDMATLLGYTGLEEITKTEQGALLNFTLYWQSEHPGATAYTRFVQIYEPSLGMAAQFDSPPQSGANPTNTWVSGELIEDPVTLTIQADALPGIYGIYVGFYDPVDGTRLPVQEGTEINNPNGWTQIGQIEVEGTVE